MTKEKIKSPKKAIKVKKDDSDEGGFSFLYILPLVGGVGAAAAGGGGGEDSSSGTSLSISTPIPAQTPVPTPAPPPTPAPAPAPLPQPNIVLGAAMSANSTFNFNMSSDNPNVPVWSRNGASTDYILKNIKDAGMNTVALHFNYSLDPKTDTFFRPNFDTKDLYLSSPTWETIEIGAQKAIAAGLKPIFHMTIIQLPYAWDSLLATKYVPTNPDSFFASYKENILKVAELSEKYDSPYMTIGVELGPVASDPKYLKYWEDIISSVRKVYDGKITYNSYVDDRHDFNTELDELTFIDQIDMVGFNVFPRTLDNGELDGTYDQFYAEWKNDIVPGMQELAAKLNKPVFISEFGFTRLDGAGSQEFSGSGVGLPTDLKEQADLFDAAFKALYEGFDTEAIIVWGAADNSPMVNGFVSQTEGYTINWVDSPAEDVIAKWMTTFTSSYPIG